MRFFIIIFLFISSFSFSAENIELSKAPVDLTDNQSLQRGARTFTNYCLNCHSAKYMRYSNLQDIGLSAETIKNDLLFTGDKIGDTMSVNMPIRILKSGLVLHLQIYQSLQGQGVLIGFIVTCEVFIVIQPDQWDGTIRCMLIQQCHTSFGS